MNAKTRHKIYIAIIIFMTLIIIGSAYADFGGFSGGGGSRSSSSSRLRSRLYHGRSSFLEDLKFALCWAGIGILYLLSLMWDGIADYLRRERRGSKLKPIDTYYAEDPSFDQNKIRIFMKELYPKMQSAWQIKNINTLSPYMTERFLKNMNNRLYGYIKGNKTDHTEKISVLNVRIEGWTRSEGNDYIRVELTSSIVSYITDDKTADIVSGDKNTPIQMRYHIDLSRECGKFSDDWKICDMTGVKI